MRVHRTQSEIRESVRAERLAGRIIGLVPTLGALHDGHRSLIRKARGEAEVVVVSIFVNRLQFGPREDFGAYPRSEAHDFEVAAAEGCDLAFAPPQDEMRMEAGTTTVSAGRLGEILEGEARPGHFAGVLTVVAKLLNLVTPDLLFLGRKDAQQNAVIARMIADLSFPLSLVPCPTVRAPDGLALSSRNAYLSPDERERAPALYRALLAGRSAIERGEGGRATELAMERVLAVEGVVPDYARAVDPGTFEPTGTAGPVLLLVAARLGRTRLIDNLETIR